MMREVTGGADTAASLRAKAARCRALARVVTVPFAAGMLARLAEQLEGEAERMAARAAAPDRQAPIGASA